VPAELRIGNRAVTPAIESIVSHCLEPDPDKRYRSARELHDDLQRHLDHLPLQYIREPSLAERWHKWRLRHPRYKSVAATILLIAAIIGLSGFAFQREQARKVLQARQSLHQLRDDLQTIQFLLTSPLTKSDDVEEAIELSQATLERYAVL